MIEEVQELVCAAHDLLVFIDDTGHEAFAGNQPYYGLGGCVVRGDPQTVPPAILLSHLSWRA